MATTARFTGASGKDNTDRRALNDYQAPTYAATLALATKAAAGHTLFVLALTGALTLTIGVGTSSTPPYVGDTIRILATSDGTTRTITFSTGVLPVSSTFAITTAKYATIDFVFNGTGWLETSRAISA